jgi:hypothetical protein
MEDPDGYRTTKQMINYCTEVERYQRVAISRLSFGKLVSLKLNHETDMSQCTLAP